jgi:enamine deaminase RidA (YjgF/YER057c/UK114 family)
LSSTLKYVWLIVLFLFANLLAAKLLAQPDFTKSVSTESQKELAVKPPSSILANNTLYISGQGGYNTDGSVPKDFHAEVSRALQGVREVLHETGFEFRDLASITLYTKDATDLDATNEVYWQTIGSDPPARTVLVVGNLPNGENIQISAVAVRTIHRQVVHPMGWPSGPHIDPPGILADDVLYLSAQSGADPVTGKLPGDFGSEVNQALDNVAFVLKAANMNMANLVWVNPYLSTYGAQERVMNKAYATHFEPGNAPARGTFTVVDLPSHSHLVFTCIAGANLSKRRMIRPRNERPSPTASPGMLYGDTLYLSAKDAYVPGLGVISAALDIQTKLSMRNLLDGLQEANMDFSNVVSSALYLRDIKDADQVNALFRGFLKNGLPAQTVLQENLGLNEMDTEQISLIAVRSPLHSVHWKRTYYVVGNIRSRQWKRPQIISETSGSSSSFSDHRITQACCGHTRYGDGSRLYRRRLQAPWSSNAHQRPRNMDVSQRITGASRSSKGDG